MDLNRRADSLFGESLEYSKTEQWQLAFETLQQALEIYQQTGNLARIANVLEHIGVLYQYIGDYPAALQYHEESLVISRELDNPINEAISLGNIGIVYERLGDYSQALEYHEASLALKRDAGNREGEATTLGNLGVIYERLGDYSRALEYYEASLALKRELGNRKGEATTLGNLGNIAYQNGNNLEALAYYRESLNISRELNYRAGEANALSNLGIILSNIASISHQSGKLLEALQYYEESLAISRTLGDRIGEAIALSNIGNVSRQFRKYAEALQYYKESLVLNRELGNRSSEAKTLSDMGHLFQIQAQPELAIIFFKQSINIYEQIREDNQTLNQDLQSSFTATIEEDYRHLADLLLQYDRILEAQQVMDLLKIKELDNYVRGVRKPVGTKLGIAIRSDEQIIIDHYKANQDKLIALGRERASLAQIPTEQRTSQQQERLVELRQLEQEVLAQFQAFFEQPEIVEIVNRLRNTKGVLNIELTELNALRDNLLSLRETHDQNAVMLYPLVLDDRLELILVTADTAPIRKTVHVSRTELNRVIGNFRRALEYPASNASLPAQQLYDWLIRPIEADLEQAQADNIIYSPDLRLRYIPLAALNDGDNWLIQNYRVNNITAASLADFDNIPSRDNINVLAAGFTEGNHIVQVGDDAITHAGLPFAGSEIETLARLIPSTVKRLNEDFNPSIILEMDDYRIIHLATHAAFNPGAIEKSYILFGNGELATLADVKAWSFPNVELVVLSACETAVGDVLLAEASFGQGEDSDSITGDEILGFGHLMQTAGAEAAMGSLWQVDDGGTQILMSAFYDALSRRGVSKVEALQQAQRYLISLAEDTSTQANLLPILASDNLHNIVPSDLSHPYYWAPFILIGNGL
ncbi:MAG: tetratricopeptide repeat protein [Leptolyngbyaceae cyanobacterium MAG.088]|nr:tetratricopeptide repeat protein [Leptolyngbyaceae cyanobacterium MAG.088]